jgi:hypothetical protein
MLVPIFHEVETGGSPGPFSQKSRIFTVNIKDFSQKGGRSRTPTTPGDCPGKLGDADSCFRENETFLLKYRKISSCIMTMLRDRSESM